MIQLDTTWLSSAWKTGSCVPILRFHSGLVDPASCKRRPLLKMFTLPSDSIPDGRFTVASYCGAPKTIGDVYDLSLAVNICTHMSTYYIAINHYIMVHMCEQNYQWSSGVGRWASLWPPRNPGSLGTAPASNQGPLKGLVFGNGRHQL